MIHRIVSRNLGKGRSAGLLFNPSAFWVGCHYSYEQGRYCINLLPCLTVWVTERNGRAP